MRDGKDGAIMGRGIEVVGDVEGASEPGDTAVESLANDETIDFITDRPIKLRGNESVRQQIARSLSIEYGIPVDDMARDYPIPVQIDGARRGVRKADIAVFAQGEPHTLENLQRVVICKPEPKGGRAVTKLRTHDQARQDGSPYLTGLPLAGLRPPRQSEPARLRRSCYCP